MKTLLVICARKGSKRLKNKHLLDVAGSPLWERAVSAAHFGRWAPEFTGNKVAISTDIPEIKEAGKLFCDYMISRSGRLASDKASIHEVLQDAVEKCDPNYQFDAVAFIPANVPTVTPALIAKCIKKLAHDKKLTSVITVRTARDLPEWMWVRGPVGELEPALRLPSQAYRMQDIPTRYVATGTVNVVRTEVLMTCRDAAAFKWLGGRIGYVLDEDAIEIHDPRDLELARAWMERKK